MNIKAKLLSVFMWMAGIFMLSNEPASQSSVRSGKLIDLLSDYSITGSDSVSTFLIRKSAHIFMFFVLGILLYVLLKSYKLSRYKQIGYSILIAFSYAVIDEIHQAFVPGRSNEIRDVIIDTVGASLGVFTAIGVQKLYTAYRAEHPIRNKADTRHKYVRLLNIATAISLGISYVIAGLLVYSTQLLPIKLVLFAGLLTSVIVAAMCYVLITNKSSAYLKNIAMTATSLLMVGVFTFTALFAGRTGAFIGSLQGLDYEDQAYSIVAIRGSNVELKQNNQKIGYIKDDPNNALVLKEVEARTDATPMPYDNITTLAVALTNKEVDSLVLRDTYLQLLSENYKSFYDSLKVLDTFSIKVKRNVAEKQPDITKPFVVYISGIDTYGDVTKVSRSDVNILAIINPQTNKILLVNTPRDYFVQLHGTTGNRDKLTHAGIYGIDMSKATLEDLFGTRVDYFVRINFNSLMNVVDTIGGVSVISDQAFTSGKYKFKQGPNELDGQAALAFSRTRYAFIDGDRSRGKNQQKVIEAIVAKIINPAVIVKNQNLLKTLEGTIQTDANDQIIAKIIKQQMSSLGAWQVESISVTGSDSRGFTYSMGNIPLYVMEPNVDSVNNAKDRIQAYVR